MTAKITKQDIARLRELLSKATPGPWVQDDDCMVVSKPVSAARLQRVIDKVQGGDPRPWPPEYIGGTDQERKRAGADMDLIAELRNVTHTLLDTVERMDAALDDAVIEMQRIAKMLHEEGYGPTARWLDVAWKDARAARLPEGE